MDTLTKEARSRLMSRIRSVSMAEVRAASLARERAGCRLTHQPGGIEGQPDYANKARKVALFFHGCFFHGCPKHFKLPKSNTAFWRAKILRNRERHGEVARRLRRAGWSVLTVGEHDLRRRR